MQLQLFEGLVNPSYLAFDRTKQFLYCVHGDQSEASAFAIGRDGTLSRLNTAACGGRNPVHLIPDTSNRFILVANFATGTIGVLSRQDDGSLGALADCVTIPGKPGPNRHQQKGMHPHQLVYDPHERFIAVPDKGGDMISLFTFDADKGVLRAHEPAFVPSRSGAAPRHMAFHPHLPFAYLVNELNSTLTSYHWDGAVGHLTPQQILPMIPDDFTCENTGAGIAISPCGGFVYASNRGHESVATFVVDATTGRLSTVDWEPTRGSQPRFFTLSPDGRFLFVANEGSDTIQSFAVTASAKLKWRGEATEFGSPTCIALSVP